MYPQGDDVRFADGTSGKIEKMGWFETMIRNSGMCDGFLLASGVQLLGLFG